MDWVASVLQELGHNPLRWDEPGRFLPGIHTLGRLIEISHSVDAAIFIFSEDDKIWYRGDALLQPRDNVLLEYGLFLGVLGPNKAIICRHRSPKNPVDLHGVTFLDVTEDRRNRARLEIREWLKNLTSKSLDPATIQLMAKVHERESQIQEAEAKINFLQDLKEDYEAILGKQGLLPELPKQNEKRSYSRLLSEYDFFWPVTTRLSVLFETPRNAREQLGSLASVHMDWGSHLDNKSRTAVCVRKSFRTVRRESRGHYVDNWFESLDPILKREIDAIADTAMTKIQTLTVENRS